MKKIFTICFLIITVQHLLGQNNKLQLGIKNNISEASVNVNTSEETPFITLQQLNINNFCPNTEIEIPFTVSGKFELNNTFILYYVYGDGSISSPIATTAKSPFKLKLSNPGLLVILASNSGVKSNTIQIQYKTNTIAPYIYYETLTGCTKVNLKIDTTYSWSKYDTYQ